MPWFIRLVQASPLTPVWTAVCVGAGLTLANFAVSGLSAGALPIDAYFVSQALGHSLMLAYVFWASHFLWSGALRDLGDLGSVLRGGAETQDARVRRFSYLRPGVIALSALAAFAFSQASIEFYTGRVGRLLAGSTLAPMDAFLLVNNFLVWLVSGPALYIGFVLALRFGRIGERHVVVNLPGARVAVSSPSSERSAADAHTLPERNNGKTLLPEALGGEATVVRGDGGDLLEPHGGRRRLSDV